MQMHRGQLNHCFLAFFRFKLIMPFEQRYSRLHSEEKKKIGAEKFKELLRTRSYMERMEPVVNRLIEIFAGLNHKAQAEVMLPDYCHNILQVLRKTCFKGIPTIEETVSYDAKQLQECKTLEEIKTVIKMDWMKVGMAFGVLMRLQRFGEMEMQEQMDEDFFSDGAKEEKGELFELYFGKRWLQTKQAEMGGGNDEASFESHLMTRFNALFENIAKAFAASNHNAYQWGPQAMIELNQGMGEGLSGFLDEDGQLAGQSNRLNIYWFLLLVWPEIKEMQASQPRKTITDLHEWMLPLMWAAIVANIDIEALRDICANPPGGIGLQLRPLSSFGPPSA